MKEFRTKLSVREKKEAFQNLGKLKVKHQVTLCFDGLEFVKSEVELYRPVYRSEMKSLEELILKQLKPIMSGLTRVIVHN